MFVIGGFNRSSPRPAWHHHSQGVPPSHRPTVPPSVSPSSDLGREGHPARLVAWGHSCPIWSVSGGRTIKHVRRIESVEGQAILEGVHRMIYINDSRCDPSTSQISTSYNRGYISPINQHRKTASCEHTVISRPPTADSRSASMSSAGNFA